MEGARRSALEHGLAAESADALFAALVGAARDVQEAFVERPWTVEPLDLEREARPAIARLSDPIVARAADLARDPEPVSLDRGELAAALDGSLAPAHARRAIARAVVALRPPEPEAPSGVSSATPTDSEGATRPRRARRSPRRRAHRPAKTTARGKRPSRTGNTAPAR